MVNYPRYVRYILWCWQKPVWIGPILVALGILPFIAADMGWLLWYGLTHWGEKR